MKYAVLVNLFGRKIKIWKVSFNIIKLILVTVATMFQTETDLGLDLLNLFLKIINIPKW